MSRILRYGKLELFVEILEDQRFTETDDEIPYPHVHLYHREFDESERKIVKYFDWRRESLRPNDRQGFLD